MTEHSQNFNKVKGFYDDGLWDINKVKNAVNRWITAAEFKEITGKDFK